MHLLAARDAARYPASMAEFSRALEVTCGQLLVVGFDGTAMPPKLADALGRGERGGVILFKRNLAQRDGFVDLAQVVELNGAIVDACPPALPPLISIDQEGGRVKRLGPPLLQVPPMRAVAAALDDDAIEAIALAVACELAALGISMSFAPVLDVDTNPRNPVIGDRAFASDAPRVISAGLAYARGLARGSVLSCAKHFPGHGDTELDSHLALPRLRHDRARLDAIELAPFHAAAAAGVPSVMTAHVVFDALDSGVPATLSRRVVHQLLREELGFRGVCFSDDLFMKGISPSGGADPQEVAQLGVRAIEAGCDALLVCHEGPAADATLAALVARARDDAPFRARCEEACGRFLAMRRAVPARPVRDREALEAILAGARGREAEGLLARVPR